MRGDRCPHGVVPDHPELLEALAVPFGTYRGVATCRPVPGATTMTGIATDLLCGLGKTEALTRRRRSGLDLVEAWMRAYEIEQLFIVGADGLRSEVWCELCRFGDDCSIEIMFVSSDPARWPDLVPGVGRRTGHLRLVVDPARPAASPPVGAALPDVGFPGLLAACTELLDPDAAGRAQAIYDNCLAAAFTVLPANRDFDDAAADRAFGVALSRTPNLAAVPLATHAVRAAGLLRGHHITFEDKHGGVPFEALLTADRLAQLGRLVSPPLAAAGVLAGLPLRYRPPRRVAPDGETVQTFENQTVVHCAARPLLRAWAQDDSDPSKLPPSPPRPSDPRHRQLWRRPPPERLGASCEPIGCQGFCQGTDPPMYWTYPRG